MNRHNPTTDEGKSICTCGHTGDGPSSMHHDTMQAGHGRCQFCACEQFTWVRWSRYTFKQAAQKVARPAWGSGTHLYDPNTANTRRYDR